MRKSGDEGDQLGVLGVWWVRVRVIQVRKVRLWVLSCGMVSPRSRGYYGVVLVLSRRWRCRIVACEVGMGCVGVCVGCDLLCGVSGSYGGQGRIFDGAEEPFTVSSVSEAIEECVCGYLKILKSG